MESGRITDEIVFELPICLRANDILRRYLRFWRLPMWDGKSEKKNGRKEVVPLWRRMTNWWRWK